MQLVVLVDKTKLITSISSDDISVISSGELNWTPKFYNSVHLEGISSSFQFRYQKPDLK